MHGREGNHSKMMAASVDLDGNVLKPMKVARAAFMEDPVAGRHGCSKRGGGGGRFALHASHAAEEAFIGTNRGDAY